MNDQAVRNMVEFSQLSGISRPTVSKYFNDPTSVRPSTRAQIEKALLRYDYRPNLFAVNLNKRKSGIIGMIVPDLGDPFYSQLVQHLEGKCHAAGLFLLVLTSRREPDLEARAVETLLSLKIAGAIMAPLGQASRGAMIHSLQARVPMVCLDSWFDDTTTFVGTNNFQSIPLITDYLCRTGERPTFFALPDVNRNAQERRTAYLQTMQRLGLQPEVVEAPSRPDRRFEAIGYAQALDVIDSTGGFPTRTILCANDQLAMGVIAAASQRGLKVGREADCHLRVAGHDDQPFSRYLCPPLTTVGQDFDRLSGVALELLLKRAEARAGPGGRPEQVRLDATLVMRSSA